jgi:polar amino acid transport system substrate-binding protein
MKSITLMCFSILVMVLVGMTPPVAEAQVLANIKDSAALNVGYVPDEEPFSFKGPDNKPAGYVVDIVKKVAEKIQQELSLPNLQVTYSAVSLADGLKMVSDGRIDLLCAAASDTLQRRKSVSFSLPIYTSGVGVLLRKNSPPDLVRVLNGQQAHTGPIWRGTVNRALAKHTYAVHGGTVTEEWVRDRIKALGVIATVVTVDDHAKGVEMVVNKKADAYFADRVILENYASRDKDYDTLMVLDRYFTYEPIALAMRRNNDDLRLVVDTTLSTLYRSGEIVDIYKRYFGEPGDTALLLFKLYGRQ